mgnify:CR=1 FL=1
MAQYISFKRPDGTPSFGRLNGDVVEDLGQPGASAWLSDALGGDLATLDGDTGIAHLDTDAANPDRHGGGGEVQGGGANNDLAEVVLDGRDDVSVGQDVLIALGRWRLVVIAPGHRQRHGLLPVAVGRQGGIMPGRGRDAAR